jgi:hypothetical protein
LQSIINHLDIDESVLDRGFITAIASTYGVPVYYYTQLQQQMDFLQSQYGILGVMDDDNWEINLFVVPRQTYVGKMLNALAYKYKDHLIK